MVPHDQRASVDGESGSEGCILSYPCSSGTSEIPTISLEEEDIPVSLFPSQPVLCSTSFHKSDKTSGSVLEREGHAVDINISGQYPS